MALLYLSASLAFSHHHHDDSKSLSHKCAACVWHFESISDAPSGAVTIAVPEILVARSFDAAPPSGVCATRVRADRGPPLFS